MAFFIISTQATHKWDVGDIISVYPDTQTNFGGSEWVEEWVRQGGRAQDFPNPHLSILFVPGEPADPNLADYEAEFFGEHVIGVAHQRAWGLDRTLIPPPIWAQIDKPGVLVEINQGQFRAWTRRKRDNAQVPVSVLSPSERVRNPQSMARRPG